MISRSWSLICHSNQLFRSWTLCGQPLSMAASGIFSAGGMTEPKRKGERHFCFTRFARAPVPVWTDQLARCVLSCWLLSNLLSRFEIISLRLFYWLSDWVGRETTQLLTFEEVPGERFLARFARRNFFRPLQEPWLGLTLWRGVIEANWPRISMRLKMDTFLVFSLIIFPDFRVLEENAKIERANFNTKLFRNSRKQYTNT